MTAVRDRARSLAVSALRRLADCSEMLPHQVSPEMAEQAAVYHRQPLCPAEVPVESADGLGRCPTCPGSDAQARDRWYVLDADGRMRPHHLAIAAHPIFGGFSHDPGDCLTV